MLVRSAQDPFKVYPAMEATTRMGGNAGNLLYANAVLRALSVRGRKVEAGAFDAHLLEDPSGWLRRTNRRYDHYVVPLANAFRFDNGPALEKMTALIERLDIPVTVVGVGAQATLDAADPEGGALTMGRTGRRKWVATEEETERHDAIVRGFAEAVLARSASIGVRGPITKRYLESIGIPADRVDVIGCPSVFTWGPDHRVVKSSEPITTDSVVSMNVDHRVRGIGRIVQLNTERYPRLTSPVQDARSARMILTGKDQYDMAKRDPLTPIHTGHQLYREGRLLYFPSPWGWISSLGPARMAFGNRLHGNIAAILAGTPAHLLAHDSRTLELAEYHRIPYSLLSDHPEPPTAEQLWEMTDYSEFNAVLPQRFEAYRDFLHRNGLTTVFDDKRGAERFDRKIRSGQGSGPVRPSV